MNNMKCLTNFAVFQDYKEFTVEDLPDNELIADRMYFSPGYIVQFRTLNDPLNPHSIFNPLEDTPFLYLEIAKIHSDDDLMKFIQLYGLPLENHESSLNDEVSVTTMDTIPFYKKLSEYRDLLHLWFEVQNHKEESLYVPPPHFNSTFISYGSDSIEKTISKILNHRKTWKESYEPFELNIAHCVRFKSLLEVSYFQLTRSILNNTTLKRCHECNEVFEVTHESQKFCPPKIGRKRSTCENTHKVRKSRQKQKQRNNQE